MRTAPPTPPPTTLTPHLTPPAPGREGGGGGGGGLSTDPQEDQSRGEEEQRWRRRRRRSPPGLCLSISPAEGLRSVWRAAPGLAERTKETRRPCRISSDLSQGAWTSTRGSKRRTEVRRPGRLHTAGGTFLFFLSLTAQSSLAGLSNSTRAKTTGEELPGQDRRLIGCGKCRTFTLDWSCVGGASSGQTEMSVIIQTFLPLIGGT